MIEQESSPFFSIIIPVYNTSNTVNRTVLSVINQSFSNIEVIIVDDCSTDDSLEILRTYEIRDKRVKVIHHEKNEGSLVSRITGMKQAVGKYVLFLDSDDWLEKEACQLIYQSLQKNPVVVLQFGYYVEPKGKKDPFKIDKGNRFDALLQRNYEVAIWNKVYDIELIRKSLFYLEKVYCVYLEDGYMSIVFAYLTNSFGYLKKSIHHYETGIGISTQNQNSVEKIRKISESYAVALNKIEEFIKGNCPDKISKFLSFKKKELTHLARKCYFGQSSFEKKIDNLKLAYSIVNDDLFIQLISKIKREEFLFSKIYDASWKKKWFYIFKYQLEFYTSLFFK